jgi:hypothetical protein
VRGRRRGGVVVVVVIGARDACDAVTTPKKSLRDYFGCYNAFLSSLADVHRVVVVRAPQRRRHEYIQILQLRFEAFGEHRSHGRARRRGEI